MGSTGAFVGGKGGSAKDGRKRRPAKDSDSDSSRSSSSGERKSTDKAFSSALSASPDTQQSAARRMASGLHSSLKNASLKGIAERSSKAKTGLKAKTKSARAASSGSRSSSRSQSPATRTANDHGKGKKVAKSESLSKTGSSMSKTKSKSGRATEAGNSDSARSSKRR